MKQKTVFKVSALLLGLALIAVLGCVSSPKKVDKVGLQLWSVRGEMQNDFEGTLAAIANAGYDQVEFAGYYDRDPVQIKGLLDSLGLTAPAAHVGYDLLTGDNLGKTIADAKALGHEYLILPSLPRLKPPPPLKPGEKPHWEKPKPPTMEEVHKYVEILDDLGKACHNAGLKFAFHNHVGEFALVDSNEVMYDILLKETDPEFVQFEMDLGWAIVAGADPISYLKKYPGRFPYLHVKDMNEENHSVVVGQGKINFASILAVASKNGTTHYIVEYEGREDPMASVAASVKYLKTMALSNE